MKYTLLAMYHPAAALHQPRLWAEMLDDWQNMPQRVPHDFRIVSWAVLEEYLGSQKDKIKKADAF